MVLWRQGKGLTRGEARQWDEPGGKGWGVTVNTKVTGGTGKDTLPPTHTQTPPLLPMNYRARVSVSAVSLGLGKIKVVTGRGLVTSPWFSH